MELCSNRINPTCKPGVTCCGFVLRLWNARLFAIGFRPRSLDGANRSHHATHHEATAKRVIFLFMEGAFSR